jgi:hypothetical protein
MNRTVMYRSIAICCALLALLAAPAAFAAERLITAQEPDVILEMAKGYGRASLSKDNDGDPWIEGKIDGLVYNIFFYGCKSGTDCESIQFEAGWGKDVKEISLDELNEWNRRKLFASSLINKNGLVRLHMDVLLRFGVTEKNLDEHFTVWRSLMKEFHGTVMATIQ